MSEIQQLLEGYHGIVEIPVQWGEMDLGQHVNNVVYLRYLESGRIAYLQEIEFPNLHSFQGIAPILAEIHVQYRLPVTFPDTLSIGTKIVSMDEYNMQMESIIVSHQWQKITTKASARIVSYDYNTKQKTATPLEMKKRIAELEKLAL